MASFGAVVQVPAADDRPEDGRALSPLIPAVTVDNKAGVTPFPVWPPLVAVQGENTHISVRLAGGDGHQRPGEGPRHVISVLASEKKGTEYSGCSAPVGDQRSPITFAVTVVYGKEEC